MVMKKIIIASVIVVLCIVAVLFFRNRLGLGLFTGSTNQSVDLIVVNDSADDISSSYKEGGKGADNILKAGDGVTGGKGFIRIYTAKKAGSYELTYPFPRPSGAPEKVTLSQIIDSAQKETIGDELLVKEGMIGDIKVHYEEVQQAD
jgi:hypothetical protein